jgi:hypothetical protein
MIFKNNKAGIFFIAAGISCGANAMDNQAWNEMDQYDQQVGQFPCEKEEPFVVYDEERWTDLGGTITIKKEYVNQVLVTTIETIKCQEDRQREDRCRTETDFPHEKQDPCVAQQHASQCAQLVLQEVCDNSQQQQVDCTSRRGSVQTNEIKTNTELFLAKETQRHHFNSETKEKTTITKRLYERRWNAEPVTSEISAGKGECWKSTAQCSKTEQQQQWLQK